MAKNISLQRIKREIAEIVSDADVAAIGVQVQFVNTFPFVI